MAKIKKIKQKTHSGAKKRFKIKGGKVMKISRRAGNRSHILTKRRAKCKRQLRRPAHVLSANLKTIKRLLRVI